MPFKHFCAITRSIDEKEYLIFCDESDRKGKFYSNFYGGVRIAGSKFDEVNSRLSDVKTAAGLSGELKWGKVDERSTERYMQVISAFFEEMRIGNLFMRVMFTKNALVPVGLTSEHHDEEYYILYYQFLKHAFGLRHMPFHRQGPRFRIYLDDLGDTKEQIAKFKGFVSGLTSDKHIAQTGLTIALRDITHVRSHDHLLMQCVDVVLGSITFRLNDKHKDKPAGSLVRGKRTRAKERLYKHINTQIRLITGKQFNIGSSTGCENFPLDIWDGPYRHWQFEPKKRQYDDNLTKAKKNARPVPT